MTFTLWQLCGCGGRSTGHGSSSLGVAAISGEIEVHFMSHILLCDLSGVEETCSAAGQTVRLDARKTLGNTKSSKTINSFFHDFPVEIKSSNIDFWIPLEKLL